MGIFRRSAFILSLCQFGTSLLYAQLIPQEAPIIRPSEVKVFENENISAISVYGEHLVLGTDEKYSIQFFDAGPGVKLYLARKPFSLFKKDEAKKKELDIEGIARSGNTWYIAGSHSGKRRKVNIGDQDRKYKKNRARLTKEGVRSESFRNQILRFNYVPAGETEVSPDEIESVDLLEIFEESPVLGMFVGIPSKENGIDIEGIATDGKSIWLGFRGPVLRNNWVPTFRFDFDEPDENEILFVNLQGGGVRDIVKCAGEDRGFLLIAGAVGDSISPYSLYYWDGADTLPGERSHDEADQGKVTFPGEIPAPLGGKAEGLTITKEDNSFFQGLHQRLGTVLFLTCLLYTSPSPRDRG